MLAAAVAAGQHLLGDRQPDVGGDLLGLAEIDARDVLQRGAVELDDALVALHVLALVDGEREHAAAQQLLRTVLGREATASASLLVVEAGIGAQRVRRREVGDQHVDRSVGAGLQDELAAELQRRAEQHGQHADLGEQARHRLGIVVARQDLVEHRPELDDAAAHVERSDLERHDMVVARKAEFAEFRFLTHGMSGQSRCSNPSSGVDAGASSYCSKWSGVSIGLR